MEHSIVGIYGDNEESAWYQFVYAMQRPHVCFDLRLTQLEMVTRESTSMTFGDWRDHEFESYTDLFSYEDGDYTCADVLLDAPPSFACIYTQTEVVGPNLLGARGKLQLLQPFLED
eukprot:6251855-Amphidinium_carterae.4